MAENLYILPSAKKFKILWYLTHVPFTVLAYITPSKPPRAFNVTFVDFNMRSVLQGMTVTLVAIIQIYTLFTKEFQLLWVPLADKVQLLLRIVYIFHTKLVFNSSTHFPPCPNTLIELRTAHQIAGIEVPPAKFPCCKRLFYVFIGNRLHLRFDSFLEVKLTQL